MEDISRYRVFFITMIIIEDLLVLNALFLGVFQMFHYLIDISLEQCQILLVLINMAYLLTVILYPIRVDAQSMRFDNIVRNALIRIALTMFIAVIGMFLGKIAHLISRAFIILYFVSFYVVTILARLVTRRLMGYFLRRGGAHTRAIILGAGVLGQKLYEEVSSDPFLGINVLGFFDDNPTRNGGHLLGDMQHMKEYALSHGVKEIYCTLPVSAQTKILDAIDFAEQNVMQFHVVPALRYYMDRPVVLEAVGNMPIFSIRKVPLSYAHNALIKRAFDVLVSGVFLVTLFPLVWLVVGIAIKLSSKGPVFFVQERTGMDGHSFRCYKFRSMRVNSQADTAQATSNDSRKTRVGDFLRRTNIDELPQFINVVKGDMSIVGPRPHMKFHTSSYAPRVSQYMVRHLIKPGITGLAQVTGYRGETKELGEMEGRVIRDIWYLEHWTLWLDLMIVWKTFIQMIRGDKKAY